MSIILVRNSLLMLVTPLLLLACSVFSPVKTEQTHSYILNTLPPPVIKKPSHKISLMVVAQPTINQAYNTMQMAYTTQPYQVAYFAKNRWVDTPARMLQSLLVEALQGTHYFYAIGLAPDLGQYDYVVNMQLLQFEQQFLGPSSKLCMRLRVKIIKIANDQVIAAKEFAVVETAPENTPYGGVVAANQAAAKMLAQVTQFCLGALDKG